MINPRDRSTANIDDFFGGVTSLKGPASDYKGIANGYRDKANELLKMKREGILPTPYENAPKRPEIFTEGIYKVSGYQNMDIKSYGFLRPQPGVRPDFARNINYNFRLGGRQLGGGSLNFVINDDVYESYKNGVPHPTKRPFAFESSVAASAVAKSIPLVIKKDLSRFFSRGVDDIINSLSSKFDPRKFEDWFMEAPFLDTRKV